MSRPRLDAEQKKVSFSLAFSPNLIAALEKVRGAKSQSVFVEEWLRQQPQIAAALAAMDDPGFTPPVMRYERLMELLLAFYSPPEEKQAALAATLFIAQKAIIRTHESSDENCREQIIAAMEASWLQMRRKYGTRVAHGESLEAIRPAIQEYAHYYHQTIFQEMAKGDIKLLQHRFRSLVHGCEAIYREHQRKTEEHQKGSLEDQPD